MPFGSTLIPDSRELDDGEPVDNFSNHANALVEHLASLPFACIALSLHQSH
jgi:hypothetical protein